MKRRLSAGKFFQFLFIISSCVLTTTSVRGAELVLVEPSAEPLPIILFKDAPPRTRDAAVMLADYIEKISGRRPHLFEGEPNKRPERAIWVGFQPILKSLFPNTDFNFQHPEEILLVANEQYLVIAGRDRWDPLHMEAPARLQTMTGLQQEYGTANAVYTFLQDRLGVRWLWPGEEDVPEQERLVLVPFEYRYHPQIRARTGMFKRLSLGEGKEGPDKLWSRVQRVQLDSLDLSGGHAFREWWEMYHDTHPDYFALQPDGSRSPHPNPRHTKICESNPAVGDRWLKDVAAQLAADSTRRVFNVSQNDGYNYGQCVCETCRSKDNPNAEKFMFQWKDRAEERPALSDRQVTFANTLGRLLRGRYPDRQLFVQLNAYGYSRPAPIAVVPDDNVIISSVSNFHLRGDGVQDERTLSMQQFDDWSNKTKLIMWRPNLGNPCGLGWGMPDIAMTQAGEDFRFVADRHCIGLFFDLFPFHWSTQGPHYYALAHLAWDPRADVAALMDDYYRRGFGPAASHIRAYWTLLEKARMEFVEAVPNKLRYFDIPKTYTPELLALAEAHLTAATKAVQTDDAKFRRRIAFVQSGLDHTKNVVENRAWMQKFEASNGHDADAKAHVMACWEAAARMKASFPEYAVNWSIMYNPGGGKGDKPVGLHPENPLSGKFLKQFNMKGLE